MKCRLLLGVALLLTLLSSFIPSVASAGMLPTIVFGGPKIYIGPGDLQTFSHYVGLRGYTKAKVTANAAVVNACDALDAHCGDITLISPSGGLSLASNLSACAVANACTIKTWYGQDGSGVNWTQATIANRATLNLGCTPHGRACAVFISTNMYLSSASIAQAQPFSEYGFFRFSSIGSSTYVIMSTAVDAGLLYAGVGQNATLSTTVNLNTSSPANLWHSWIGVFNGTSNSIMSVDGSTALGSGGTAGIASNIVCWGGGSTGCTSFRSTFNGSEMGMIASAPSATLIQELNINQFDWW